MLTASSIKAGSPVASLLREHRPKLAGLQKAPKSHCFKAIGMTHEGHEKFQDSKKNVSSFEFCEMVFAPCKTEVKRLVLGFRPEFYGVDEERKDKLFAAIKIGLEPLSAELQPECGFRRVPAHVAQHASFQKACFFKG